MPHPTFETWLGPTGLCEADRPLASASSCRKKVPNTKADSTIRRSYGTRTYITGSLRELNDTRKALTCMVYSRRSLHVACLSFLPPANRCTFCALAYSLLFFPRVTYSISNLYLLSAYCMPGPVLCTLHLHRGGRYCYHPCIFQGDSSFVFVSCVIVSWEGLSPVNRDLGCFPCFVFIFFFN